MERAVRMYLFNNGVYPRVAAGRPRISRVVPSEKPAASDRLPQATAPRRDKWGECLARDNLTV